MLAILRGARVVAAPQTAAVAKGAAVPRAAMPAVALRLGVGVLFVLPPGVVPAALADALAPVVHGPVTPLSADAQLGVPGRRSCVARGRTWDFVAGRASSTGRWPTCAPGWIARGRGGAEVPASRIGRRTASGN